MLTDNITGESREIDVVAQTALGAHKILLSIECRDHARPADVLWVEGMSKKHECLPTSKLILWSRSGFTKSALLKAYALKIDTISQKNASTTDWAHLARNLIDSRLQYVTPQYSPFIDVTLSDGTLKRLEHVSNAVWFDGNDRIIGTITALLNYLTNSNEIRTVILDNATSGKNDFYIELTPPEPWYTKTSDGLNASILRIGVGLDTFTEVVLVDATSAEYEKKIYTLGSATLKDGKFELLIEESADGNKLIQSSLKPS